MNIKRITKNNGLKDKLVDIDSGVVFNPHSKTIKMLANRLSNNSWGNIAFRSKRRGYAGYYYVEGYYLVDANEEEQLIFLEFFSSLKKCASCGEYYEELKNDEFCGNCFDNGATRCAICGEIIKARRSVFEIDGVGNACHSCANSGKYKQCDTCGVFYDITLENSMQFHCNKCDTCFNKNYDHSVLGHQGNPPVVFKKLSNNESNLFFGFELEMDNGGTYNGKSIKIGKIVGDDVFFKRDGSIPNGFEMVSQPMQYEYFMERKELYSRLFSKAIDLGYQSHTTNTCGLHFHMSKDHFTSCEIAKLIFLFEKHWENIQKFTRRTSGKLNKWASRYGDFHANDIIDLNAHNVEENADRKLNGLRMNGRYKAVNLRNANTIEIRVFRGTLNINTFIASMQFLNHLVTMIKTKDFDELRAMSWAKLMKNDYQELNEYLLIRGLSDDKKRSSKKVVDK